MAESSQSVDNRYQAPTAELVNAPNVDDGMPLFVVSTSFGDSLLISSPRKYTGPD